MAGLLRKRKTKCDACGEPITEAAGHGTLLKTRGDAVEHEDKPLCERCAHAIGMTALFRFAEEEEEG
jgi:formylmethanofuran dehydrogenase subunit E